MPETTGKLVLVERYNALTAVEKRLNELARDPKNRYDLKFFTHTAGTKYHYYTIVLCWTPEIATP